MLGHLMLWILAVGLAVFVLVGLCALLVGLGRVLCERRACGTLETRLRAGDWDGALAAYPGFPNRGLVQFDASKERARGRVVCALSHGFDSIAPTPERMRAYYAWVRSMPIDLATQLGEHDLVWMRRGILAFLSDLSVSDVEARDFVAEVSGWSKRVSAPYSPLEKACASGCRIRAAHHEQARRWGTAEEWYRLGGWDEDISRCHAAEKGCLSDDKRSTQADTAASSSAPGKRAAPASITWKTVTKWLITEDSSALIARLNADPTLASLRDEAGIPLLHDACQLGRLSVVKAILRMGESVHATTPSMRTPLHAAVKRWINPDEWQQAMKRDDWAMPGSMVETLIRHGADVNARTSMGNTALHIASVYDFSGAVRALIQAGALVDVKDKQGRTPLALAVRSGAEECATLLRGAAEHGLTRGDRGAWSGRYRVMAPQAGLTDDARATVFELMETLASSESYFVVECTADDAIRYPYLESPAPTVLVMKSLDDAKSYCACALQQDHALKPDDFKITEVSPDQLRQVWTTCCEWCAKRHPPALRFEDRTAFQNRASTFFIGICHVLGNEDEAEIGVIHWQPPEAQQNRIFK